jgi:hypothetical protein
MNLLDSLSLVLSMLKDASHGRLIDILPPAFILVVAPYRTFKGGHEVKSKINIKKLRTYSG